MLQTIDMLIERAVGFITERLYHKAVYTEAGDRLEPVPYLSLPFRRSDLSHIPSASQIGIGKRIDYGVSEGWYYSKDVTQFIPYRHAAVDFSLPYGFPVASPCEGYAMSSYYSYPLMERDGRVKKIKGKNANFGIGYFVQIYNPTVDRFVQLGHLSNIDSVVPFSIPRRNNARWEPTNHLLTVQEITSGSNPHVVKVKVGDSIGTVGYSGLCYEEDYKEGYDRPLIINPKENMTWSIPHIHMDEFQRNYATGKKDWRRDPYDIYSWKNIYPTHSNNQEMGTEPLFLTDQNNLPYFADT